jgi:hypothetical protein
MVHMPHVEFKNDNLKKILFLIGKLFQFVLERSCPQKFLSVFFLSHFFRPFSFLYLPSFLGLGFLE